VGVGHEQLTGVGGAELAAERAEALRGERRARAAVSRPSKPTVKLSICEVPTRVPISLVPVPLNSTSPGWAELGRAIVEPGIGVRLPQALSRKPV
jgi:hypothetical protein